MTSLDLITSLDDLKELALTAQTDEEMRAVTSRIAQVSRKFRLSTGIGLPRSPVEQAQELDEHYVVRPHLQYLSDRIANAVRDVERGQNRMLAVSMPPRAGKTELVSKRSPLWMLRRHPEWKIVLASYDGGLSNGWAKSIRTTVEANPQLGIALAKDGGSGRRWDTLEGGGVFSTSVRGGLTGRGARVLIVDDPIKDFVEAHSQTMRQNIWDWWLSVAQTRLEPPYLVITVMTRWHEDDFVGRLLSPDNEGDPRSWEKVVMPAIAEKDDILGRAEGDPLMSPIINESKGEAIQRWSDVRRAVGSYTFSSMYQQRPAPAKGAIFDAGWWRYWTTDASKATADGRVVYVQPEHLTGGQWVDSWDAAFGVPGASSGTSWVVGQRWVRQGANRYMVAQRRGRWTFTQTIAEMEKWARNDDDFVSPFGHLVHDRLIEAKANGVAIIDVLKEKISGIKPVVPTTSKEARARAVTPEVESGNVYLPHPSDPDNEWVGDLLSELRNFPHDANDDQVDALTQALSYLRNAGRGRISVPGQRPNGQGGTWQVPRNVTKAALTDLGRRSR